MPSSHPIRVAIIGLSASAATSWAAEAHLPYLLSPRGRSHYEIVALLNSSVRAAEAARTHFKLPSSVKAYGDPTALAADPEVDLVVCNTRVDIHFPTIEPSIKAGKAVYVEWPLADTADRARILAETVQNKRDSIIGLQGRIAPPIVKIKEVLDSGRIGRVLSSEVRAFANLLPRDSLPESLAYFVDPKLAEVGGYPVSIAYAHMIDYLHSVLGEYASFEARMQVLRPKLHLLRSDGSECGNVISHGPDFVAVHGPLAKGRREIADGATLAVTFRNGPSFKGAPAFEWSINGERGEVRVTSPAGPFIHSDSYWEPISIELHDYTTDEVMPIEWDWQDWQKELPTRARNVGEQYERYARWVESGKVPDDLSEDQDWSRLEDARVRHEELAHLFEQYDAKTRV